METYNPIDNREFEQEPSLFERLVDFYWLNQTACDCVLFLSVCAIVAYLLVAIA